MLEESEIRDCLAWSYKESSLLGHLAMFQDLNLIIQTLTWGTGKGSIIQVESG
jgi:hypothetical protein